jgi:multidrug resistance efflux pump
MKGFAACALQQLANKAMASGIVEPSSHDSEKQQQQQQGVPSRQKLVQRLLSATSSLPAFVHDLLTTQAVVVAGTEAAGFIIEKSQQEEGTFSLRAIAHIRPDNSTAEVRQAAIQAFTDIIQPCIVQNKDGAIEISGSGDAIEPQFCLVTLLRNEGQVVAVSAVITRCRDLERAQQRLMSMQLVAGYFDLYTLRRTSDTARVVAQSHQHVLQLATAVATAEGFQAAANNFCNELAIRTGAARVSVGWLKGKNIKVAALSHTEQFDKKQELIVHLQNAMEECLDQEEAVQFDPGPDGQSSANVTRDAQALSRAEGGHVVLSLPLRRQAEIVGVVTLEFAPNQRLGPQAATGLAVAVDLLAPQLYDRHENDRWLITKVGLSTRETAKLAIGPKHMLAKLLIVLAIVGLWFISPWSVYVPMYHVSAPFQFAPIEKRSLPAPYDGIIEKVNFRPGDPVKEGDVLIQLETYQLELDLAKAEARAESLAREADLNYNDPTKTAEYKITLAQRDEALAEADLLRWKISQASLIAPYDGEVLKGDLKDKVGSPVKMGDVLMELGEEGKLQAELAIAERDIQQIQEGQEGDLATTNDPRNTYRFKIDRVVRMGTPEEGSNVFKVYALPQVDQQPTGWLPGMAGEARVDIERKSLAWIWTHRVVDFLVLKVWSWM